MSNDKPRLYTIERALIERFPEVSVQQFTLDIKNGLKPSVALSNFIKANNCTELDSSVILDLLRKSFKEIYISLISGIVHDSGYPFGDEKDLNDETFDELVERACE